MDSAYIQHIRYKLQKRLKRINSATRDSFRTTLIRTWAFLQSNEISKGILDDLERRVPEARKSLPGILDNTYRATGLNELENDAIAYWVMKSCATTPRNETVEVHGNIPLMRLEDQDSYVETFRQEYVEPLFDYIEEQIDDKRITLVLLKKYKHRCEWFRREELLTQCRADTRRGEEFLAYDLYEYLHDQGIQFHIEPQSEAGRIDMISTQTGIDRLVADAKIFNPAGGQNTAYIVKGFRQIHDYLKEYNESFGYLVIFKTCEQDLSIQTAHRESAVPFITHNNKTIFLVVIDLCEYGASASKRGKLRAYEIAPAQFVKSLARNRKLR